MSTWLVHELRAGSLNVICIDARHAKAALSMQLDKNDRAGHSTLMRTG